MTDLQPLLDEALTRAAGVVEEVNRANGWFDDDRTFGDDIALLHSEVSEALEAYRDHGLVDVTGDLCPTTADGIHIHGNLCKPEGVGSELADVLVRLLDTCTRRGINLADEFHRKVEYNATRGHRHGGKRL
jgi:NTP pyrophosphatase (non-canonical NTP hydrolase)